MATVLAPFVPTLPPVLAEVAAGPANPVTSAVLAASVPVPAAAVVDVIELVVTVVRFTRVGF